MCEMVCANCVFCVVSETCWYIIAKRLSLRQHECRKHAPIAGNNFIFPHIELTHWCGDWQSKREQTCKICEARKKALSDDYTYVCGGGLSSSREGK